MNYQNMKTDITIDGNKINTVDELHDFLATELDLPNYYGKNLDALWDILSGVNTKITIKWIHFIESENKFGNYANQMVKVFEKLDRDFNKIELHVIK